MKKSLLFALVIASLAQGQSPSSSSNGGRTSANTAGASTDAGPIRYTFLTMGNKAGYEQTSRNADGSRQVHFEFNDRGRGPSIDERIVAGKDGIPTLIEIKGVDYLKAPVEERFSVEDG